MIMTAMIKAKKGEKINRDRKTGEKVRESKLLKGEEGEKTV